MHPIQYQCPSCKANEMEHCRLPKRFAGMFHETRHRLSDRARWEQLNREMALSTGWTVGPWDRVDCRDTRPERA